MMSDEMDSEKSETMLGNYQQPNAAEMFRLWLLNQFPLQPTNHNVFKESDFLVKTSEAAKVFIPKAAKSSL